MVKTLDKIGNHAPLKELAYQRIKASILANELQPGQKLLEEELASQMSISPTPVREALAKLDQEGIVRIVPRKGAYVTPISRKDVHEIYQIRRALEPLAMQLSIDAVPAEELEREESLFDLLRPEIEEGKRERFLESDIEFHYLTVRYCGNARLIQIIGSLSEQLRRIRTVLGAEPNLDVRQSFQQHCDILAALKARDGAQAVRLLQQHLETAEEKIAARLPE